jgi:hypothetical protein
MQNNIEENIENNIQENKIQENSIQENVENIIEHKIEKKDECIELKNIKYKTMLLSGKQIMETKSTNDLMNLDKFLENEKNNSKVEPWSKLDKTIKVKKLQDFAERYVNEKKLNDEESQILNLFFKDCLDKKRLARVKDVIYDKTTGIIKDIPALHFNKQNKHFTLKNLEKRVATQKSLQPKKVHTIKNKESIQLNDNKNINYESDTSEK